MKATKTVATIVSICLVITLAFLAPQLWRVYRVITLFGEDEIVQNFRTMNHLFDERTVHRAGDVWQLDANLGELPQTYVYDGETRRVHDLLDATWTTGFLVLKDGEIFFEQYYRGHTAETKHMSWSLAKSFVSALVGCAVRDGHIKSIAQPVTEYVEILKGTGYDGVSIKNVMQMSSGIEFNEDYGDFDSDINRMGRALAFNTSIDGFVASLKRGREPGTHNHYVSMDTQVLAMVLREATQKGIASYLQESIWGKIGMEADAYLLLDVDGMELAFGGLNAVLRDYARFGLLYMNGGSYRGDEIIPAEWVRASVTPDAPHLMPGRSDQGGDNRPGYGYQWWIPAQTDGDFVAMGVYGQFIWVHPKRKVVIAKNSAYPDYNRQTRTWETVAMFKDIARQITSNPVVSPTPQE